MVCGKCEKKLQKTELATPGVKNKNDKYFGSPSTLGGPAKGKATLGSTGVGKSKLLSAKAKNPYAAYSGSCESCKAKTAQGRKFCHKCAFQKHSCPMCGKSLSGKSGKDEPLIQGRNYTLK
ncbi:hypothetical protein N7468_003810 [Penicillium chermesinum]|uniref:Cysteine-rich PDZ-binding protein n=1 Tax=Penicillium chermesinum TaxID=63820 RepID=A0A9W9P732_9EURO|nr:uncharacterized protein N7468_003810 [Penicillium chermesinum]KAJ5239191.1 hypothetical protein N7468_003810 [Penicillium chermesinum]